MLPRLMRAASKVAERHGYTIAPDWRLRELEMARHLRRLFARCAIDCAFDVGANTGQYARFLRGEVG